MEIQKRLEGLQRRFLADEPDAGMCQEIRDLLVTHLESSDAPLGYCEKEALTRAIASLSQHYQATSWGGPNPKLHHALLQFQLALLPEEARPRQHRHDNEIIDALTRNMLLTAARDIDCA